MTTLHQTTTFILIKPDGVNRKLVGKIISRFEDKGFTISSLESKEKPELYQTQAHYAEHAGKPFFERITSSLAEGPVVYFEASSVDAVKLARAMIGQKDAFGVYPPGTIRGDYANGLSHQNVIHASDSEESAQKEIAIWYAKERDTQDIVSSPTYQIRNQSEISPSYYF